MTDLDEWIAEEARFYEAECLRRQGKYPKSVDVYHKMLTDFPAGADPTLERAVAPGFTTKSTGSGLGLTLVQRILDQHSGRFFLESNPGIGTRAWFTLPVAPEGSE